jgi:peptide deformylase
MDSQEKIRQADLETLKIIHYPDPRLKEVATPVDAVDDDIRQLAAKMTDLMFAARGVGLAAPQVGVTVRLFLASPTFDRSDLHVYINPEIVSRNGSEEGEEGCLSFPDIYCKVKRARSILIRATNLEGEVFEQELDELHARICQHENDHLDGMLLADRMSTVAKLANRKALRNLEAEYVG